MVRELLLFLSLQFFRSIRHLLVQPQCSAPRALQKEQRPRSYSTPLQYMVYCSLHSILRVIYTVYVFGSRP
ncbi:uncharacterized protein BDV14DRAFT_30382 [Aspergillus stella-maris]|uniref:uncharacterized protein n=1 Tax=Aspergillus stella-maris TaxID=1810926 RepID=UPI003CCCC4DE